MVAHRLRIPGRTLAVLLVVVSAVGLAATGYAASKDKPAGDSTDPEKLKACNSHHTLCYNACRNGTTLSVGSSKKAISSCSDRCDRQYATCLVNAVVD